MENLKTVKEITTSFKEVALDGFSSKIGAHINITIRSNKMTTAK